LLHPYTHSGILIDCIKKTGNDADGKKQAEPSLPWHFFSFRHILHKGDQNPCGSGHIRRGLENLPEGCIYTPRQVSGKPQIKQQIDNRAQIKRYFFLGTLHMDTLETLYFPDTVLTTDGQSALFLLFNPVHVLQPVETDTAENPITEPTDTFMDAGFCQVHTPAPLGTDRDRFLHLVRDIQNRKDDYAAQLSSLTLASMSVPLSSNGEARHEIISSLFGIPDKDPADKEKEEAQQAELWQARLVLAIGEILDREEEEIADAMSMLNSSETALFDRLLGKDEEFEDEDLFKDLKQLKEKVNPPRPGMIKNRFRAWLSLYRAGNLPDWWLWTTTRLEAADILLEMFEKKTDRMSIPLWQSELPAATGIELMDHMDKIETFKKDARAFITGITKKFNDLVRQEISAGSEYEVALPEAAAWGEEWEALLETHFPTELYGRTPICFHLLCNLSLPELAGARSGTGGNGARHGILAVVG
jgi:hypothetical protein